MHASRFTLLTSTAAALTFSFASMPVAFADGSVPNPNETVTTGLTAAQLAQSLVGAGISVSNATLTGAPDAVGHFAFTDPTVVGFGQGLVMSSGKATDVVGPNVSDSTSTDWAQPGDADLTALSGFPTFDAAVLEFDFTPVANQVVFQYAFASEEYPEWVHTPYNDVFAFLVNGTNCATVRQVAGDPTAPFVPVAVNNINDSNPVLSPPPPPDRPDLFRANYPAAPSPIDLEQDGITSVLTCQSAVNPGVTNHMKLAIADASDGIYDSAVFIQAGSLVSNQNPVADLSVSPNAGTAPLALTAAIEGEDPNGLPLTYSINWGDGTSASAGDLPPSGTALVPHTFTTNGHFTVTLTVSNGTLAGTSSEDVDVSPPALSAPAVTSNPVYQTVHENDSFTFSAAASGVPAPTVQWQVSTDGGASFGDVPGATDSSYGGTATLGQSGHRYRAVFTNSQGSAASNAALLTVIDATPPSLAPSFSVSQPFLRFATGITASPNATDASGIAAQSCDAVDTSSVGAKTLTCTATDNAGNTASVNVPYVVGFGFASVSPADGSTFKHTSAISVSFQLADANGVISDAEAAALVSSTTVAFDGLAGVQPSYKKQQNLFSASLKTAKPASGAYTVTIDVVSAGVTLAHRSIPITIV